MDWESISDLIDKKSENMSSDEILPIRSPSFQSRLLSRFTSQTSMKRSVSVPHRSQNSSSISPKPNKDKLCMPDFESPPTTPAVKSVGTLEAKNNLCANLQSQDSIFRSIQFKPSKFLHRSKSHRTSTCVDVDKLSMSLPEASWANYLSKLSNSSSKSFRDSSPFKDPMLAELDSGIPDPRPPPRACPPWLKLALQKQTSVLSERCKVDSTSDHNSSSHDVPDISISTATKLEPSFTSLQRQKSVSLGGSRICPVIQNGVKMSDTHYWLLAPPRSRCDPIMGDQISPDKNNEYLNEISGTKLRRGGSAGTLNMVTTFHRNKIALLKHEVPFATYEECEAVLIGASYNYEEAFQKLLLELLSRHYLVSREKCKQVLIECNWDLEDAIARAKSIRLNQVNEAREIRSKRPQKLNTRRVTAQPLLPSPMEPRQFPSFKSPQKLQPEPLRDAEPEVGFPSTFQAHNEDIHEPT